jgi:glutaredoxin
MKVLHLKGCNKCKELLKALREKGVEFDPMEADDNGSYADYVEDLLGIDMYPIIVIEKGKETTFIYVTDNGAKLGPRRLAVNILAIGCLDVVSMLKNI